MTTRELEVARAKKDWAENPRWQGVKRGYTPEDVYRLRGSLQVEHTLARRYSGRAEQVRDEGLVPRQVSRPVSDPVPAALAIPPLHLRRIS